jgi:ribonuclease HI
MFKCTVLRYLEKIMVSQAEFVVQLQALAAQAVKTKGEILAAIAALEAAVATAGDIGPEVQAAFADAKAAVQGIDDLNADAP